MNPEDFPERRISGLTVRIDRTICISSGNCMKLAPDVFEFDSESICTFKANLVDIDRERLIEACRVCPVDALMVIDKDGVQLVP